ncbi:MAG TPA: TetR/AcrR family transcriptional regulator [Burkholderiaceae bacterium]|nr:TetR/AcrR family transcriptional regulator [Burkholderiaceae bacterium]
MKKLEKKRLGRPKDVHDTDVRCLHAAELRFASMGFDGATLRDIAKDIQVTSATIIHHFGTKERLYGQVMERLRRSLDEYLTYPDNVSIDSIIDIFEQFLDWTFANQHYAQLILRELMENRSRVPKARRLYLHSFTDRYVKCIQAGQEAGLFRQMDGELFAFYTFGAITHFSAAVPTVSRMLNNSEDETIARFKTTLKDTVRSALSPATSAAPGTAASSRSIESPTAACTPTTARGRST